MAFKKIKSRMPSPSRNLTQYPLFSSWRLLHMIRRLPCRTLSHLCFQILSILSHICMSVCVCVISILKTFVVLKTTKGSRHHHKTPNMLVAFPQCPPAAGLATSAPSAYLAQCLAHSGCQLDALWLLWCYRASEGKQR